MKIVANYERWMSRLPVSVRLFGGFGVLLLFVLIVGATGVGGMYRLQNRVSDIVVFNNAKLALAQAMRTSLGEQEKGLLNLVLASDSKQKEELQKLIAFQTSQYEDSKSGLADLFMLSVPNEAESKLVAKIHQHETTVAPLLASALKLASDDETEAALKLVQEQVKGAVGKWVLDIDELVSTEQRLNDKAAAATQVDFVWARGISLACIALAIVLGAGLAILIARGLRRELGGEPGTAAHVANQVAAGNLSLAIPVRTGDTTSLMAALKGTVEQLSLILRRINEATETIHTAAGEIASGNSDLSQRTEQQASSLQQTAASMEQLTSTVKQNADNARQANQLASGASDVAIKGGQVVGKVVATMSSINDSSKKIAEIIGVIDGIAFQTNILALNAAVEAARAGEQGRGFAVVASEVRNLAQRSAAAAKEIKQLITESVLKVDDGTRLVAEAGKTMDEIVAAVGRVTSIIAEITDASQEQSSGIAEVSSAITLMDQVTQQNAALVEQAAAAAESMRDQAQSLTQVVAVFKFNSHRPPEFAPAR